MSQYRRLSKEEFLRGAKEYFDVTPEMLAGPPSSFDEMNPSLAVSVLEKMTNDSAIRNAKHTFNYNGYVIELTPVRDEDELRAFKWHNVKITNKENGAELVCNMKRAVRWFIEMWLSNSLFIIQNSKVNVVGIAEISGDLSIKHSQFEVKEFKSENSTLRDVKGHATALTTIDSELREVMFVNSSGFVEDVEFINSRVTTVSVSSKVSVVRSIVEGAVLRGANITGSYIAGVISLEKANVLCVTLDMSDVQYSQPIYKVVQVQVPTRSEENIVLLIGKEGAMVLSGSRLQTLGNWHKNMVVASDNQVAKMAYLAVYQFMDSHSDFYKFCGK